MSSAMLRKYGIKIQENERQMGRMLGILGASTIEDKVTIVFEVFGNRVDLQGWEIDLVAIWSRRPHLSGNHDL